MLFASLPLDAKVTPEQVLDQRARIAKPPWPMWSYGKRGDMIRDLHWPVRNAEGKLVSKEVVSYNASGYVHAHLLHAYIGNSQDDGPAGQKVHGYGQWNRSGGSDPFVENPGTAVQGKKRKTVQYLLKPYVLDG